MKQGLPRASVPKNDFRPRVSDIKYVPSQQANPNPQLVIDSFLQTDGERPIKRLRARSLSPDGPARPPSPRQRRIDESFRVLQFNEDVLIADDTPADRPDEVIFLTRQQYANKYGEVPSAHQLDQRSILIRNENGDYITKEQTYQAITPKSTIPRGKQKAERDRLFSEKMERLGLSTRRFGEYYQLNCYVDTPAGSRWRGKAFTRPLEAGQNNPDLLMRTIDGHFRGVYPKLRPDMHPFSIDEIVSRPDIDKMWLKDSENNYLSFIRLGVERAQNIYVAFLRTNNPHRLPNLLLRRDRHSYIAGATYGQAIQRSSETVGNPDGNYLYNEEVLLRTRNGKGLFKPSTLSWMSQNAYKDEHFIRRLSDALDLPPEIFDHRHSGTLPVLVMDPRRPHVYLDGAHFQAITGHSVIAQPDTAILVQNHTERGGTGNFSILADVLDASNDKVLTTAQRQIIGRDVAYDEWRFDNPNRSSTPLSNDLDSKSSPSDASYDSDVSDTSGVTTDSTAYIRSSRRGTLAYDPWDRPPLDTSSEEDNNDQGPSTLRPAPGRKRSRSVSVSGTENSSAIASNNSTQHRHKRLRTRDMIQTTAMRVQIRLERNYVRIGRRYFATGRVIENRPESALAKKLLSGDLDRDVFSRELGGHGILPSRPSGGSQQIVERPTNMTQEPHVVINTDDGFLVAVDDEEVTQNLHGQSVIECFGHHRVLIRTPEGGYRTYAETLNRGEAITPEVASAIGVESREKIPQVSSHDTDESDSASIISWSESDDGKPVAEPAHENELEQSSHRSQSRSSRESSLIR